MSKIAAFLLILVITGRAYAGLGDAMAISAVQGVVNAGSAVYMQSQGVQPQFVLTNANSIMLPNGLVLNNYPASSTSSQSAYQAQNQQAEKQSFLNQHQ